MIDTNLETKIICQNKLNKYFIYLTVIPKPIAEDILEVKKGDKLCWYITDHGVISIKKKDESSRNNQKDTEP